MIKSGHLLWLIMIYSIMIDHDKSPSNFGEVNYMGMDNIFGQLLKLLLLNMSKDFIN